MKATWKLESRGLEWFVKEHIDGQFGHTEWGPVGDRKTATALRDELHRNFVQTANRYIAAYLKAEKQG